MEEKEVIIKVFFKRGIENIYLKNYIYICIITM